MEGNDYIKRAELMQESHPYWAERKMGLFVPVMVALEDDQFGIWWLFNSKFIIKLIVCPICLN